MDIAARRRRLFDGLCIPAPPLALTAARTGTPVVKAAGVIGPTAQAVREAELAARR